MPETPYRVLDKLMLSLFDKEAAFDAGPGAWLAANAVQLFEFPADAAGYVTWPDIRRTDRDTVHAAQLATQVEIVRQDVQLVYRELRVRPTHLVGLAALAGGSVAASVQDGALTAWRHKLVPVEPTAALPSIGGQEQASGEQYKYTGLTANSFRLFKSVVDGAEYWGIETGLVGSGTRVAAADAFPAVLTEKPLLFQQTKCWLETGADIALDATPAQGTQNISSSTPDDLTARLRDVEFLWNNDLQLDKGYAPGGTAKVRTRLDHGERRGGHVRVVVEVDGTTLAAERAYYTGQVACALEVAVDSGLLIAATGAYHYGFDLIVPRCYLDPITRGVENGRATITLEGDVADDLTNDPWILYGYIAAATLLG